MINPKYSPYLFSFLMALFMSGVMSLVISMFNVGLTNNIVFIWLKAWGFAFVVAFPVITAVAPVVRKIVAAATRPC